MGKLKKKFRKTINQEKSNKMIYAVGIGLALVFTAFVILLSTGSDPKDKEELIMDAIGYLKKTKGILGFKIIPAENTVRLIYDSNDRKDFVKIARYAGIKLSLKLKEDMGKILLFKDSEKNLVISIVLKNGQIIEEY